MTRDLYAGVKAIILDIEGTITSHSFIEETIAPYVRTSISDYVWDYEPDLGEHLDAVRKEENNPDLTTEEVIEVLLRYLDEGTESTALQALQAFVLAEGYKSTDMLTPIYEDALRAFKRWHEQRIIIYSYSKQSEREQRLLFAHTQVGDISGTFDRMFNIRIGERNLSDSYEKIAASIGLKTSEVLFFTDNIDDAVTASNANMNVIVIDRQACVENAYGRRIEQDFDSIIPETVPA